jgi:hypothetical protein
MKRTLAQREDRASCSAKREKIVKAAGPVLKRYGLSGTTTEAIAKEADVDRATGSLGHGVMGSHWRLLCFLGCAYPRPQWASTPYSAERSSSPVSTVCAP